MIEAASLKDEASAHSGAHPMTHPNLPDPLRKAAG